MKFVFPLLFAFIPVILNAQQILPYKLTFGADASMEIGRKSYPGIHIQSHNMNDNISTGGGIGGGIQCGKMLWQRFLIKTSILWQLAPQGLIMAEHDTTSRFSKLSFSPSLRYYVPIKRKNSTLLSRTRWFVGAGPQIGIKADMKEKSLEQNYSAEIKYKPSLGLGAETGFEIFFSKRFSVEVGMRAHYIKYSLKSYRENGLSLSADQAGSLKKIDGSGAGYYGALKVWL